MQNLNLIEKIQNLPPETVREVEDFVDSLAEKQARQNGEQNSLNLRERGISQKEAAEQRAALTSFAEDWNLPEMEIYDEL